MTLGTAIFSIFIILLVLGALQEEGCASCLGIVIGFIVLFGIVLLFGGH